MCHEPVSHYVIAQQQENICAIISNDRSLYRTVWVCVRGVKSIFTRAQYVTQRKYFSHPSLVIYFFATPNYKTGTANMWKLLIANHLDHSLRLANQQQGHQSHQIYYALLYQVHSFDVHFTSLSILSAFGGAKPELNRHILTFLLLILVCRVTY